MLSKKTMLVAGALTTLGAASAIGLTTVSAATNSGEEHQSIVDKIATTFNLDEAKVQEVFDQDRTEHEAERQARMEERLTQAVKDGKLTEDQKAKILAKAEELKAEMGSTKDDFKDKTPEEVRKLMEARHDALQKWAEDNNIPEEYMMFGMHVKHHGPGGGEKGFHMRFESKNGETTTNISN